MILYTVQVGRWRLAERRSIPFLDVTVKSGDQTFSPTWDFLMAYKEGRSLHPGLDPESSYVQSFKDHMRKSFVTNKERWLTVINLETVAIGCYCASGKFCHRILLVELFSLLCAQYGIEFTYAGELEPDVVTPSKMTDKE